MPRGKDRPGCRRSDSHHAIAALPHQSGVGSIDQHGDDLRSRLAQECLDVPPAPPSRRRPQFVFRRQGRPRPAVRMSSLTTRALRSRASSLATPAWRIASSGCHSCWWRGWNLWRSLRRCLEIAPQFIVGDGSFKIRAGSPSHPVHRASSSSVSSQAGPAASTSAPRCRPLGRQPLMEHVVHLLPDAIGDRPIADRRHYRRVTAGYRRDARP